MSFDFGEALEFASSVNIFTNSSRLFTSFDGYFFQILQFVDSVIRSVLSFFTWTECSWAVRFFLSYYLKFSLFTLHLLQLSILAAHAAFTLFSLVTWWMFFLVFISSSNSEFSSFRYFLRFQNTLFLIDPHWSSASRSMDFTLSLVLPRALRFILISPTCNRSSATVPIKAVQTIYRISPVGFLSSSPSENPKFYRNKCNNYSAFPKAYWIWEILDF